MYKNEHAVAGRAPERVDVVALRAIMTLVAGNNGALIIRGGGGIAGGLGHLRRASDLPGAACRHCRLALVSAAVAISAVYVASATRRSSAERNSFAASIDGDGVMYEKYYRSEAVAAP